MREFEYVQGFVDGKSQGLWFLQRNEDGSFNLNEIQEEFPDTEISVLTHDKIKDPEILYYLIDAVIRDDGVRGVDVFEKVKDAFDGLSEKKRRKIFRKIAAELV